MDFIEKKQNAINILDIFSERMKWGVFSNSVRGEVIPKAINYSKLIDKVEGLEETEESESILEAICQLIQKLKENVAFGEKAVRLGKLESEEIKKLQEIASSCIEDFLSNDSSWLMSKEPSLRPEQTPELIFAEQTKDETTWYFNAARSVTSKEEIPASAFNDEFIDNRNSDEKFYAIKKTIKRCIDIVSFNAEKEIIEFRIDNTASFSSNERFLAFHMLDTAFKNICREKSQSSVHFEVLELFDAITKLYEIPVGNGRVVELSFATDEGGIKRNKKRLSGGCILEEEFHKSGCQGIDNQLTPYRIARVWSYQSSHYNSEPELLLPGTLRMASQTRSSTPILNEFLVSKVVGHSDYAMVTEKLISLISLESTDNADSSAS